MPEFLEKRFSIQSRYVPSIVLLVTFVVSKIAVGIFAGGGVFATLLPELHIGTVDSFWVGSIAVIVLTGLYTMIGGMRAVAYTDAVQVVVPSPAHHHASPSAAHHVRHCQTLPWRRSAKSTLTNPWECLFSTP